MPEIYHYLQQLVNGLAVSSTYALTVIDCIMVYGIIGMINFTHGEMYMIDSYIAFIATTLLAVMGLDSVPLIMFAAFVASIIVISTLDYSIGRIAYRPLCGGNCLIPLISAAGMSIFLQNAVILSQDSKEKAIPTLLPGNLMSDESSMDGVVISYMQILTFAVTFLMVSGLIPFISRSRLDHACRACAEDLKMTNLLGTNSDDIVALVFVVGAVLVAVAAVLLGMQRGVTNPGIGFFAGIKAFAAAMLDGIGSIPGAVLGGLLLGVVETFGADVLGDQYKDVVAFGLLVLVLLFRPTDTFGRSEVEKIRASPSSTRRPAPSS